MCVPNLKTFDQTEGYLSSLDRETGQTDRQTDRPTYKAFCRPPGSGKNNLDLEKGLAYSYEKLMNMHQIFTGCVLAYGTSAIEFWANQWCNFYVILVLKQKEWRLMRGTISL